MKGIAFALDPDGYWIEVIPRAADSPVPPTQPYTFAQTMIRIADPKPALHFYCDLLGMTLLREAHFGDFSLYFLADVPQEEKGAVPDPKGPEAGEFIKRMFRPVLELTHNHGTEGTGFRYHNGNDTDAGQIRGFGHVGFLVDDLDAACAHLQEQGVAFKKKPSEGTMRGLAFAYDPDGYWVEIIQRGGIRMLDESK